METPFRFSRMHCSFRARYRSRKLRRKRCVYSLAMLRSGRQIRYYCGVSVLPWCKRGARGVRLYIPIHMVNGPVAANLSAILNLYGKPVSPESAS